MEITVKLFASLRNDRFEENAFYLENGSDINCLLEKINIKRGDVAIIFINGRHGDYDTVISEGDSIALFPPIGGG